MNASCGRTAGFSMIEVMVALLVIAVAVFGTAKIQALAVNATHNSAARSIAALQAASMAAAMHANPAYWGGTGVVPPATVATYAYNAGSGTATTTLHASLSGLTANCSTGSCTPTQMASYDTRTWLASVQAVLPAGGANVNCAVPASTVPETCTVQVMWTEKQVATTAFTAAAGPAPQSFTLVVQP